MTGCWMNFSYGGANRPSGVLCCTAVGEMSRLLNDAGIFSHYAQRTLNRDSQVDVCMCVFVCVFVCATSSGRHLPSRDTFPTPTPC